MEATDSASSSPEKSPAHEDDDMMSSLDDSYLESYGFNFQDTYRHVLKFYKGTHLKAFEITSVLQTTYYPACSGYLSLIISYILL